MPALQQEDKDKSIGGESVLNNKLGRLIFNKLVGKVSVVCESVLIDKFYDECMDGQLDVGNWDAYCKVMDKLYNCPPYFSDAGGWWTDNVYKSLRHRAYNEFFPKGENE